MSINLTVGAYEVATEIRNNPQFLLDILDQCDREFDDESEVAETFSHYTDEEEPKAHSFLRGLVLAMNVEPVT